MSETAQTLIKSALRQIGAYAAGENPTMDELNDALEALKFMLRHWAAKNIRIYFVTTENFPLTGATYYTIGSGGTFNTSRPTSIRGGYVRDSNSFDHVLSIIDEKKYRELSLKELSATSEYLWYSPEYPLGKIYLWPLAGSTLFLHSLKPLSEPSLITSTIAFPPEYDEAIKYGLALRLAPEYGREPSPLLVNLATSALNDLEIKNFEAQINTIKPEIINIASRYNIEADS